MPIGFLNKNCLCAGLLYTGRVRLNWNWLRLAMLAMTLAWFGTGCAGINAGGTVSPATFFLPGLMKAEPLPATNAPCRLPESSPEFAQAR
jgi:hypothetical protein